MLACLLARVAQGRTRVRAATQIQLCRLTQSRCTDTGPTSPSADPVAPGAWQGSHRGSNFHVRLDLEKNSTGRAGIEPKSSAVREGERLTTEPARRCVEFRVCLVAGTAGTTHLWNCPVTSKAVCGVQGLSCGGDCWHHTSLELSGDQQGGVWSSGSALWRGLLAPHISGTVR